MSELPTASVAAANRQTIWNKAFVSIFLINIVLNVGQFMMNTLIPKFAEHLGGTALIVGMVSSMFAVTALGIRPVVGPATGYFRHNRLLAAAIGMIIVAFICYGFASTIGMLVVGRLFHGVGMGFLAPLCLSLASDALPSHKIASGIGIFSLGQAVATAIGPSIGLELVKGVGYNHTFQIGAALMAVVLLLALRLRTRAPNREQGFRISMSTVVAPEVVLPALIMLFLAGAYSTINSFILIYGKACGVQEIGLFFYGLCGVRAVHAAVQRQDGGQVRFGQNIDSGHADVRLVLRADQLFPHAADVPAVRRRIGVRLRHLPARHPDAVHEAGAAGAAGHRRQYELYRRRHRLSGHAVDRGRDRDAVAKRRRRRRRLRGHVPGDDAADRDRAGALPVPPQTSDGGRRVGGMIVGRRIGGMIANREQPIHSYRERSCTEKPHNSMCRFEGERRQVIGLSACRRFLMFCGSKKPAFLHLCSDDQRRWMKNLQMCRKIQIISRIGGRFRKMNVYLQEFCFKGSTSAEKDV
ncbi:MFS transporter [Cohnella rhizosphaerae]|uniref:MFS transporter n=1 Tax=Cohnella rhizosphaerae TaxID=1457232 RepID=A0A9X4KQB8_9BACL|nr:MFS transporter [Cohnella rhizosphaerae]MDG0808847.1 MFS transporter [Cohnella rhizosphaerae]